MLLPVFAYKYGDEFDDQQYAKEASDAAAAAAALKLENTYEDATLGEYMKSIKRLRGETPEQIRAKRARIAEAELAASVDAISRDDIPVELLQKASEQYPVTFDDSDEEWYTVGAKTDKDGKSVTIIVRDVRGRMVRKCMCSLTLL